MLVMTFAVNVRIHLRLLLHLMSCIIGGVVKRLDLVVQSMQM